MALSAQIGLLLQTRCTRACIVANLGVLRGSLLQRGTIGRLWQVATSLAEIMILNRCWRPLR